MTDNEFRSKFRRLRAHAFRLADYGRMRADAILYHKVCFQSAKAQARVKHPEGTDLGLDEAIRELEWLFISDEAK